MATWGFTLTKNWKGSNWSILAAASALSLGIVLMHFTAMGALTIIEGGANAIEPQALSKPFLLATILAVSISMLASGISASIIAFRAARQASASETRFELLLQGVTDYAIYMGAGFRPELAGQRGHGLHRRTDDGQEAHGIAARRRR